MTVRELAMQRREDRAASRRTVTLLVLAAVTGVFAPVAYMAMFTGFHSYDDEGYFLVVLRDYLSGQPLLNPSVPIYGPFFFETMGGLFKLLGVAPSHESGRYVTLAIWLVASLSSGLSAYRLTRSFWLAVGAEFVAFQVLRALTNEPMSPTGLIGLLLVSMVAAASFRSARPRATAVVIGSIVGALCLIKINVGGFAAIAVSFAWAASLAPRRRRQLLPLIVVVITLLPVALMASLLSRDWVAEYAWLLALAGAAVGIACLAAAGDRPPASGFALAGGGAIVVVICLGVALVGGSRAQDLWDGLVLVSLRFPSIFMFPLDISIAVDVWASAVVVMALATRGLTLLSASTAGRLRLTAGLLIWLSALLIPSSVFLLALPLLWVACIPPTGNVEDRVGRYCRCLVPALAVTEALQVYPVAGTQVAIAGLSLVPAGAIVLHDGIRQLQTAGWGRPSLFAASAAPAALLVNVLVFLAGGYVVLGAFSEGTRLGVPGAESIRVPAEQASQLQGLTDAIDRSCSSFISLPGMNSLYLWTHQSPPTNVRAEIWMLTLDDLQQGSLVRQLESRPRLCVVENQKVVDFWAQGRRVPNRPLVDFIRVGFVEAGTFGDYQLLVRSGD